MGDYVNDTDKAALEVDALERAENAEQSGKRQVWERMAGESSKAYCAFARYRDMAERRTMAKVATMSQCSPQNIHRWARRWNWTLRCREFDLVEEEKFREQTARDRVAHRRRQVTIGQHLQSIAVAGLRELQARAASKLPLNLAPSEVAILLRLGDELEGRGLGEDREGVSRFTRINVVLGDAAPIDDAAGGESIEDDRAYSWKNGPPKLAN